MHATQSTMMKTWQALLCGSLIWAAGVAGVQAAPNPGWTSYAAFAIDYFGVPVDAVTGLPQYPDGYGPTEDQDGDGLTNIQEFNGWSAVVNGALQVYTWNRTTYNANPGAWVALGPDIEDVDSDCDGMSDLYESNRPGYAGTNPQRPFQETVPPTYPDGKDTDGDGISDPIEIYAGLDPKDDGRHLSDGTPLGPDQYTLQYPGLDPDGDGIPTSAELPDISFPCATVDNPFPFDALDSAVWTDPLNCDTDGDWLLDSFERAFGFLDPLESSGESDADPDLDGLTTWREQCLHPLLANFYPSTTYPFSGGTPLGEERKVVTSIGTRFPVGTRCLVSPGYLQTANFNKAGDAVAYYGHDAPATQIGFPGEVTWLAYANYWTDPGQTSVAWDSDGDMLSDGWEVEHGLNPLDGLGTYNATLGDPDVDRLVNLQEYFGADGYRIDYRTGTGDETIPWITRAANQGTGVAPIGFEPAIWMPAVAPALPVTFVDTYSPVLYPGFFDPTLAAGAPPVYTPVAGTPSFPFVNDMATLFDQYGAGLGGFEMAANPLPLPADGAGAFQPFLVDGLYYLEPAGSEDGRYTPGIDALWIAQSPGVFTPASVGPPPVVADVILADPDGTLAAALAPIDGYPLTDNVPLMMPMAGRDTDQDGRPDSMEIRMDVTKGKMATSPVHSHNPLVPRSAKILTGAGLSPFHTAPADYFSRDFSVEMWVMVGAGTPSGILAQGLTADGFAAFELGLDAGVPYIAFDTVGGTARYVASAARAIPAGRWVHLAGTFDHYDSANGNALTLYINGALEQSRQVTEETAAFMETRGSLVFAQGPDFADNLWVDEIRVWKTLRTATEIMETHRKLITPVQPGPVDAYGNQEPNGLVAYYSFEDGALAAESLIHSARCSLVGYAFPHDATVLNFPDGAYIYPDSAFALPTEAVGGDFNFDAGNPAPVDGGLDNQQGEWDSDGDGLPDSWELIHEFNPYAARSPFHAQLPVYDPNWAILPGPQLDSDGDLDGDGLTNLQEYWARTNPRKSDTDADGILDGEEDFDGDGLSNRMEASLGSRPDLRDTDDDGIMDSVERTLGASPVNSGSPSKNVVLYLDGNPGSHLEIEDRSSFRLADWTVEAKVLLTDLNALVEGEGASLVRRTVQDTANNMLAANFELRVVKTNGYLTPEARYIYVDNAGAGQTVSVRGSPLERMAHRLPVALATNDPYPSEGLTHLAATYDSVTARMVLYLDGTVVTDGRFPTQARPPQSGKGARSFVRVGEGFTGFVDDIRIWSTVRSESDIYNSMGEVSSNEEGLLALYTLDDGGWPLVQVKGSVIQVQSAPIAVPNIGDRYLVAAPGVGAWVGQDNDIAEWTGSFWGFTEPEQGMRLLNYGTGDVLAWDGAAWSAPADPAIIRSVDYLVEPVIPSLKMDGVSWLDGGNIVTIDSGVEYSTAAPGKVFWEGALVVGSEDLGDMAWWNSRGQYYRWNGTEWLCWGPALHWLSPARIKADGIYDDEPALLAAMAAGPAVVGDRFIVKSDPWGDPMIYMAMATDGTQPENYAVDPINPGDRFLLPAPDHAVVEWTGTSFETIATASSGGELFIQILDEGIAYKSDNSVWSRWSYIPSSEDGTVAQDWMNQWKHAAQISGHGSYRLLDGASRSLLDSDGDGLPDDWEIANGLDPNSAENFNGRDGDPDGDGLSNWWEYMLGYDPQDSDTNNNGLNDGEEDYDRDGLPNWYEQEVTGTLLDHPDTDDDGLTDYQEAIGKDKNGIASRISSPLNSLDPPIRRSMKFEGNGRLAVEAQPRHHLKSWTLMGWVKPSENMADGSLLIRRMLKGGLINYELGLRSNRPGYFAPYVRHKGIQGAGDGGAGDTNAPLEDIICINTNGALDTAGGHQATGLIAAGDWTHIAGTYDAERHTMSLFINGELSVYRNDVFPPGGMDLSTDKKVLGDLTIGGGVLNAGTVEAPFEGWMDDVKVLAGAASGDQIRYEASKPISTTLQTINVAIDPEVRQLPINEALQYEHTNDFVLVRFKAGSPVSTPSAVAEALGLTVQRSFTIAPIHRLQLAANDDIAVKLAELRADPNVLYAEPDYILRADRTPNDPLFLRQWGLQNASMPSADISAVEAWEQATGSEDVIVAVIDSGVDYTHPDLAANMWVNKGEIPNNNIDDDGNGYVDDVYGWNFSTFDVMLGLPANDPMDYNGHGTHVAGIIGAVGNNSLGVAGVNWKVKIMPVNFLGFFGMGFTSDAIMSLEYAWQNGARISNNSWGGGAYSQALRDAIEMAGAKGHLFVAAAGNGGPDLIGDDNDLLPHYPSSYDVPYIVAVAATDASDLPADFSNYGVASVDLAAPGVGILSTFPRSQYLSSDGTSMAAPFVSGAAALLLSRDAMMQPLSIKRVILESVDKLDSLKDKVLSGGRLNLAKVIGGSPVLNLRFDDGGATAEDFTVSEDWSSKLAGFHKNWFHAAMPFNASFSTDSFIPLFEDTDGDGMPDWWEEAMGLDPLRGSGLHGADGDPDGDGLTNYYEYLAGTNPFDPDTDHDGINDFNADSDGDGLTNGQEQHAGTLPGDEWLGDRIDPTDTDDDGISDREEIAGGTDPIRAGSPAVYRAMRFAGSGRLVVGTEHAHDASLPWTVEAWVKPIGATADGVIIRRAEKIPAAEQPWVDYELGLSGAKPYVEYAFRTEAGGYETVRVAASKAIPANKWTHVAAVRDPATLQTRLFVNGKSVAGDSSARLPAVSLRGVFETSMGDGLVGELDAVRTWHYARAGSEIQNARDVLLPEANLDGSVDKNRAPKRIFNFDDGGQTAANSFYLNDWMANWQNAAILEGDAAFVTSPWPPADLDSDDDASTDVDERSNNTLVLRAESPYVPRALNFSGLGSVLATEQVDGLETMLYATSNWTVEAWVKPMAKPGSRVTVVRRATRDGDLATFELGLTTNLAAYVGFNREDDGYSFIEVNTGSKLLPTNEWTHLAATYSIDRNRLILYVNGVEQIRGTDLAAQPVVKRAGRLYLGDVGFVGEMKEIRVWNKARDAADIYANFSKTLLFSVAALENSFRSTAVNQSYLGRVTEPEEDGFTYDHKSIGVIGDEYRTLNYIHGHLTHTFTLETWIRMEPGAKGGRAVTRQVDLMLVDQGSDWRITEALVVEDNGVPAVEWNGQVDIATPIYEEEEIPNPDPSKTNTIKRKVLNRLEYSTVVVPRKLISEVDIRDGQWHHLAAVGDSQRVRLYVDGNLETEALTYYVFKARPAPSFETLYWQYPNDGSALRISDETLEADLDEVMFWNMDRTQDEIKNHMKYGLTAEEIKRWRRPIDPIPENAINDYQARLEEWGQTYPRVDLVSYMFFDGTPPLPFVVDAANEPLRYRILPDVNGNEILRNSRPPIFVDRLRALKDDLVGYFPADDGGETAENFMKRNDLSYAGLLQGDAAFVAAPVTLDDTDGDGLPDWWEEANDLDAGDPDGANGAYGDADGDGLSNIAEYLAGTDPNNWDTDGDGISDFDSSSGGLTFGELYMDGDMIPDVWEVLYSDVLSPLVNDAHSDPDGDGWDNLSEYLGSGFEFVMSSRTDGDTNETGEAEASLVEIYQPVAPSKPNDSHSFPAPEITFTFNGDCTPDADDLLIVQAFSDLMMRKPDAVHTLSNRFVNGLQETVTLWNGGPNARGDGHVRQGTTIFMAFIDANNDGRWTEGEWMGFSENGVENIQWGSADVRIVLTDKPAGYIRFSWEQDMAAIAAGLSQVNGTTYRVSVKPVMGSSPIYTTTRNLESMERPYITEMDLKQAGVGPMFGAYQWAAGLVDGTTFATGINSIVYSDALTAPVIRHPANTEIVHAHNRLRVKLSKSTAQLTIRILRGSVTVYSTTVRTPQMNNEGEAEMDLPWLAGWGAFTNGNYKIQVTAINPLGSSDASSAAFSVNLQEAPLGAGMIRGRMAYHGAASGSRVVEAFEGAGFDQKPVSRTVAAADGSYTLMGLRSGTYSVRGFVDANGNGVLDSGEAWGFVKGTGSGGAVSRKANPTAKTPTDSESPYAVEYTVKTIAVAAQGDTLNEDFMAYDSLAYHPYVGDLDGDGLTDAQEAGLGTHAFRYDTDFDGLGDGEEVARGTDPLNPDTDGDGMPDGWEVANGLNPLLNDASDDGDGDGLSNLEEFQNSTDPENLDTDGDGMPDGFEVTYGLNPLQAADADEDWDRDGLTNLEEYDLGTDPSRTDTDGDGMPDGYEAGLAFLNPLDSSDAEADQDDDGLSNLEEFQNSTDPENLDTDGDGLSDGDEVHEWNSNPLRRDTDFDGIDDGDEVTIHGTNPALADSDGDGFNDGVEIAAGTDPLSSSDYPTAGATAETEIVRMETSGDVATVTYRVDSMSGSPAYLEFMINDDLRNGEGWVRTGVQQQRVLSEVGAEFDADVPDPTPADRRLNIRIESK